MHLHALQPLLLLASLPVPADLQDGARPPAQSDLAARVAALEAREQELLARFLDRPGAEDTGAWYERLSFGGYGEIHYNSQDGPGKEQIDLHRFVLYTGYRFSDWIRLNSELEIEHALVADDAGGEVLFEQLHVDFDLTPRFGVRVGRFLTPLGIINQRHEPTTFHGVERPLFDTVVLPSTWSGDGIGVFARPSDAIRWELYVQSSLDGSGFDAVNGIRGGRQEERPGMSQPAFSGRIDCFSLAPGLRVGLSGFVGGLDNGNQGSNPGVDADIQIASADAQYSVGQFDFRGACAYANIDGAATLPAGTASAIDGWNVEAAWRCMPAGWRTGKLDEADAALFVRYDRVDTQRDMPGGAAPDPRGERDEITFGVSFLPVPNLVLKADFQVRDDDSAEGLPDRFNLGLGWSF